MQFLKDGVQTVSTFAILLSFVGFYDQSGSVHYNSQTTDNINAIYLGTFELNYCLNVVGIKC